MAPVVGLLGFGLFDRGLPAYLKHIKPFKDVPIFERFPVLIRVTIIWVYAHILTSGGAYKNRPETTQISCCTDRANLISSASWFKPPFPGQWGPPTFHAGHIFAMVSAVLVSMIESTASYKVASRLAIATPPACVLSRGIGWQEKAAQRTQSGQREHFQTISEQKEEFSTFWHGPSAQSVPSVHGPCERGFRARFCSVRANYSTDRVCLCDFKLLNPARSSGVRAIGTRSVPLLVEDPRHDQYTVLSVCAISARTALLKVSVLHT